MLDLKLFDRFVKAGGDLRADHGEPVWPYQKNLICLVALQPSPLALFKLVEASAAQTAQNDPWDFDTMVRGAGMGGSRFRMLPHAQRTFSKYPGYIVACLMYSTALLLQIPQRLTPLMCAVRSRNHANVLLLLHLRGCGIIKFSPDAVNSNGDTAAQMSHDPRITDIVLSVQALDGAVIETREQRAALVRDAHENGLTRLLMTRILAEARRQVAAATVLLAATQKTPRSEDAREAVSSAIIEALDQIGPNEKAVEAFMFEGRQKGVSFVRLLLKFKLSEVPGHPSTQNAVTTEWFISGIDFSSLNAAQQPSLPFLILLLCPFGFCPANFPVWYVTLMSRVRPEVDLMRSLLVACLCARTRRCVCRTVPYHSLAISCNFWAKARHAAEARSFELPPFYVSFR